MAEILEKIHCRLEEIEALWILLWNTLGLRKLKGNLRFVIPVSDIIEQIRVFTVHKLINALAIMVYFLLFLCVILGGRG